MVSDEMGRRFGDSARITYIDVTDDAAAAPYQELVSKVRDEGLLYPVTAVDGDPVYEGAVSYPAILRAVTARLEEAKA